MTTTSTTTKVLLIEFRWYERGVLSDEPISQRSASIPGEEHENIDGDTEQENHSIPHEPVEANERRKSQITQRAKQQSLMVHSEHR